MLKNIFSSCTTKVVIIILSHNCCILQLHNFEKFFQNNNKDSKNIDIITVYDDSIVTLS